MRSFHRTIVVIAVTTALAVPTLAAAQRQHTAALGDLMTAFVQPRHIKLGLAGKRRIGSMPPTSSISYAKPSLTSPRSCQNIGICRSPI